MYKYICYHTNRQTEDVEKQEAKKFLDEKIKTEIGKALTITAKMDSEMEKLDKEATKELDYMIPHQDCWISNTDCAIKMFIEQ